MSEKENPKSTPAAPKTSKVTAQSDEARDLTSKTGGAAAKLPDLAVSSPSETASPAVIPGNGAPPLLERAPLAYENPTFLNSPDGRPIRIVSEFLEPLARFRREQIQDTVVFFGSARFGGREEADHALELLNNTGSSRPAPTEEQ